METQTQTNNKENVRTVTRTRVHGYLQHKVAETLKGRHPYKPVAFKELKNPKWVTTPVAENIIPKMKGKITCLNNPRIFFIDLLFLYWIQL